MTCVPHRPCPQGPSHLSRSQGMTSHVCSDWRSTSEAQNVCNWLEEAAAAAAKEPCIRSRRSSSTGTAATAAPAASSITGTLKLERCRSTGNAKQLTVWSSRGTYAPCPSNHTCTDSPVFFHNSTLSHSPDPAPHTPCALPFFTSCAHPNTPTPLPPTPSPPMPQGHHQPVWLQQRGLRRSSAAAGGLLAVGGQGPGGKETRWGGGGDRVWRSGGTAGVGRWEQGRGWTWEQGRGWKLETEARQGLEAAAGQGWQGRSKKPGLCCRWTRTWCTKNRVGGVPHPGLCHPLLLPCPCCSNQLWAPCCTGMTRPRPTLCQVYFTHPPPPPCPPPTLSFRSPGGQPRQEQDQPFCSRRLRHRPHAAGGVCRLCGHQRVVTQHTR